MQLVGIIPELREVLTHYHHMFNKTDTSCCQIKMVWWRTWVLMIICLRKQTRHVTCQFGYGVVPGCCADPVSGYQMLSSYFYVSQVSRQTYIETMQPRPFEECSEKGTHTRRQPVRCLCMPHKRTLFGEGRRGVQPRLFVYFANA